MQRDRQIAARRPSSAPAFIGANEGWGRVSQGSEASQKHAGGCTSSSLASKPLMALKPKRRRFGVISFMGAKETQNWQGADETQEHQVLHPRG